MLNISNNLLEFYQSVFLASMSVIMLDMEIQRGIVYSFFPQKASVCWSEKKIKPTTMVY